MRPATELSARPRGDRPAVLVLGAGFLGAAIARDLVAGGCRTTVLTRTEPSDERRASLRGAEVEVGDASDHVVLQRLLDGVTEIVYAIGSASPAESSLDPAGDIGRVVPPLIRLLELMRSRPGVRLTYLSSGGAVYGNTHILPIPEHTPLRPVSSYGIIKATCEQYVEMYCDVHGTTARIVRIGNVYGPGQLAGREQGVVARLLAAAMSGAPVPIFDLDGPVRDYVYVDDVASAVARLVTSIDDVAVVNLATSVGHNLREVVDCVRAVTGRPLRTHLLERRGFDVRANVLDTTVLRELIAYDPIDLATGIARTWSALLADWPETDPGRAPAPAVAGPIHVHEPTADGA